jgi:hypothetical protein
MQVHPRCRLPPLRAQVPAAAGSTQLRSDAAVNAANLLCSLAELPGVSSPQECMQLLQQAVGLYQGALSQEAGDADVRAWAAYAGGCSQLLQAVGGAPMNVWTPV